MKLRAFVPGAFRASASPGQPQPSDPDLVRDAEAIRRGLYGNQPAATLAPNRGTLDLAFLDAADRAEAIFEVAAPDAPGLVFIGAMTDARRHLDHAGASATVSAGGCGGDFRQAFLACVGEMAERVSQRSPHQSRRIEAGSAAPLGEILTPRDIAALDQLLGDGTSGSQADASLPAHALTRGAATALPAALCLHPIDDAGAVSPAHIGIGCASGPDPEFAMRAGLLEWVERDAAALWWMAGRAPRQVPLETLEEAGLLSLIPHVRQGLATRRSWLLDITSDLEIPCVASVSFDADGGGFVHGSAARPTLAAAARAAFLEMCQIEVARHLIALKMSTVGAERLGAADKAHQARFAVVDAERWSILQPSLAPAPRRPIEASSGDLAAVVEHLARADLQCLAVDLTVAEIGIPVFKTFVPGLQPLPSAIRTSRLADAERRASLPAIPVPLF
ncbi:YcaO-like family protein [Phreatobacter stygius]|uniref:YcaO domain-containing protein n=1 Tax=Phreatobacter stygius TaxID=1940610 RepID=A0A4D7BCX0_9HYPH|nr:YcaO-like family protein [Phreatobacter stygius]QCI68535.1 hypothetical protein E8M01_32485 [Phreatobacter stygius]